jgi:hypothetical protein
MPIPSGRSAKPRTAVACPQNEVEPVAEHPLSEALSPAEARVLRYLPTLLSLREIGDELYLSVNTIKVHVRHIYAKSRFTAGAGRLSAPELSVCSSSRRKAETRRSCMGIPVNRDIPLRLARDWQEITSG